MKHGILIVDKPQGPTSHDVVAWARRAFATRSVGHAGTLDPMATGVLVLAVGEGTKLVRWLTADDKRYRARIALGAETDTLDADGEIVERASVPEIDVDRVRAAAAPFLGATKQRAPAFSAIKVDGKPLHERARRGEAVEAPERDVEVRTVEILEASDGAIELEIEASKGFYVRSFARDLARALGTRGHLTMLRRLSSGRFTLDGALDGEVLRKAREDEDARTIARAHLRPLAAACASMPHLVLDERGVADVRHGRAMTATLRADPIALLDERGELVGIGACDGERLRITRGIRAE